MDALDPAAVQVVGGWLLVALLFVLREVVSGALREAGKEFWRWVRSRRRRSGGRIAGSAGTVSAQRTPKPSRGGRAGQGYAVPFAAVVQELNAFWQRAFAAAGRAYREPSVKTLEAPVVTACGPAGPERFAFYCPAEEAIYYAPAAFAEHRRRLGDFAPIVVMAHEWGHHVQRLLGMAPRPGNASELQADCLAGAYARDAGQRGLLDPGDLTEAVASAAAAGDPLGLPQDAPGGPRHQRRPDHRLHARVSGWDSGLRPHYAASCR